MNSPTVFFEDDEALITQLSGSGTRLVLAFTGLRHMLGGLPVTEFTGSASDKARNHVLFISDLRCTWYSSARLVRKIVNAVIDYIAQHKITETVAIGNSMGGYGAILFAAHLPIRKVIAFVPQISMHPEVLLETRWIKHRPNFGADLARSVVPSIGTSKAQFFVFFGADSEADAAQAALLPSQNGLRVFTLCSCGHNVADFLKKAGLLKPVLDDILETDGAGVSGILNGQVAHG